MSFPLKSKVAIITGASLGIGRAIAIRFARAGATVVAADIHREPESPPTASVITRKGGKAIFIRADVSKASDIHKLIQQTVKMFNGIDVIVNNAGIGSQGSVTKINEKEWQRMLSVNLTSVYLLCREVLPLMLARGGGKIINISSIFGIAGTPGRADYTASKAGVIGLTRQMAVEYGPSNINVNAICPGFIQFTGITRRLGEQKIAEFRKATPFPRLGTPEDIAGAALFLASSDSDFINGITLVVDGGRLAGSGP